MKERTGEKLKKNTRRGRKIGEWYVTRTGTSNLRWAGKTGGERL